MPVSNVIPNYNGFANFPTWLVWSALLENGPLIGALALESIKLRSESTNKQAMFNALADRVQNGVTLNIPYSEHTIQQDVLMWALGYVDWRRLAEKIVERLEEETHQAEEIEEARGRVFLAAAMNEWSSE